MRSVGFPFDRLEPRGGNKRGHAQHARAHAMPRLYPQFKSKRKNGARGYGMYIHGNCELGKS